MGNGFVRAGSQKVNSFVPIFSSREELVLTLCFLFNTFRAEKGVSSGHSMQPNAFPGF